MSETQMASGGPRSDSAASPAAAPAYAALDLGTNNCRLLIATPTAGGFRVLESFSRIVRLGEGLSASGALSEPAMDRALGALSACAEKIRRRRCVKVKAIATQACRGASNSEDFLARVAKLTGLSLEVISPKEEAHLSVAGCLTLLDRTADVALVLDVGGGSTELSWVDMTRGGLNAPARQFSAKSLPIRAWLSVPIGVVTLAEQFPEGVETPEVWFSKMVETVKREISAFTRVDAMRPLFAAGRGHLVGTSGAITSLAGLHLDLPRYDRARVDGLWMTRADCEAVRAQLLAFSPVERARQACIGPDRADLVLAGAAILEAVQALWPCERVRVADRGLREGLLLTLMSDAQPAKRRRRKRGTVKRPPGLLTP